MMLGFMESIVGSIPLGSGLLLLLAIGLALTFEFVNGFHDTANAVATVIYTHSLRPTVAVVWSGIWNLIGVLSSSGAVAFGITALLPVELVLNVGSAAGFAMVFSLLLSAIVWNLGTWYLGLPASSSHTLIGSILGVGLGNSLLTRGQGFGEGVNWGKASEVGVSLLASPLAGFVLAAALLLLAKATIRQPQLYAPAETGTPPPGWIRTILVLTCTGVSFAHGSNDGQKGMGLIMLILIGILPGAYALDQGTDTSDLRAVAYHARKASEKHPVVGVSSQDAERELSRFLKSGSAFTISTKGALSVISHEIMARTEELRSLAQLSTDDRRLLRTQVYLASETIAKLQKTSPEFAREIDGNEYRKRLQRLTRFIPSWVKIAVALSLGLGTMIGWKRIVVTVGEKIGKEHLSYAQGACAEVVAMTTIGVADVYGLPVSTTHVLSSGIAGTMAANHSGLQPGTLRSLLLAWVLTLPVCVFLGAALFALALNVLLATGLA